MSAEQDGLAAEDLAYLSLVGWCGYIDPSWVAYPHSVLLCQTLEKVARGEIKRLIVTMPPQHGKSMVMSRGFPSWFLGRYPDKRVILASYEANYAAMWGRRTRDVVQGHGGPVFGIEVKRDSSAADHWELKGRRGIMHTAGACGPVTGHTADLLIIDDPIKNREEAESQTLSDKLWEWYTSVAMMRLSKTGAVVVLMTRWTEHDLAGRLVEKNPGLWTVLNLPAIAEENDPLGRKPGEVLCPDLHPLEQLREFQSTMTAYEWAGLMQQRPTPRGGGLFKKKDARYYSILGNELIYRDDGRFATANDLERFVTVDTATSEDERNDMSSIMALGYDPRTARVSILDLDLRRMEAPELVRAIVAMAEKWKTIAYIEENATSKHLLSFMEAEGIPFRLLKPGSRSKFTRALPATAFWEQGRIVIPESAEWRPALDRQLYSFTGADGGQDDAIDSLAYGVRVVIEEIEAGSELVPATTGKLRDKMPPGSVSRTPPPGLFR